MLAKYSKPSGCQDCVLEKTGSGFAPAVGPSNARIAFIGEALGFNEAMQGVPFIGAAGGLLDRVFRRSQVSRDVVKIHNCISCRPPDDWLDGAPWQHSALTHCRGYLQDTLDNPNLQVVVTMGNIPMRQILDLWGTAGVRVQDFHGTVHRDPSDRYWVVPTYHPSFLQRGAINFLDVMRFDLGVAQKILNNQGQFARTPHQLIIDPPVERFRRLVADFQARLSQSGFLWLPVDIETPDKEGGRDEGELTSEDVSTNILRVNFSFDEDQGVTVPYEGPYIPLIEAAMNSGAWLALWNKSYDESRLRLRGHTFLEPTGVPATLIDGMWAAHHLQSDLPLGLGFWGPFYSDFGAWKHLGKEKGQEGAYAAIDGLQTRRVVANGIVPQLQAEGLWDAFWRHTHLREQYVLRPSHLVGAPVSVPRLDAFHEKLQGIAAEKLTAISASELTGSYKPKDGYATKPKGKEHHDAEGVPLGTFADPIPSASVIGAAAKKGDLAKHDYMIQGTTLVQREVEVVVKVCHTCGRRDGVGPRHKCKKPVGSGRGNRAAHPDLERKPDSLEGGSGSRTPEIVCETVMELGWFCKLPFTPDASKQMLAFIQASGEIAGRQKKTKKPTADKETLKRLFKKTGNPVYKHTLDYKAVKKVDSTYVVGSKKRIWADGRLHPLITFRPSMFRDSSVNPNLQNVVADKEGKKSLAAGFRDCLVADPGYRIVEFDYSGIEGVDTGWLCGDQDYTRLATLGVHAYLTAYILAEDKQFPKADLPTMAWSDADLSALFKDIKKRFPLPYDKAKRCVHGNNYGLTVYGMHETFKDVYPTLKDAQRTQDVYYALCPKLPAFHTRVREIAYQTETLGGPPIDDYTLLTTSGKHHPFGYRHKFFGVQSLRPLAEGDYRKLQWVANNKLKLARHPRVRIINGRPFEVVLGEDSKRVIAFFPQSIAAGTLKEAELSLFHPDSPDYIGEIADGVTPLVHPIHDSLLLHVPDRVFDLVCTLVVEVMRRPIPTMPLPDAWNMGSHLRINVAAKASPVGGSWGDVEELSLPDMAPPEAREVLYLPVNDDDLDVFQDLETIVSPVEAVA